MAGIDVFLSDPGRLGTGVGPAVIRSFLDRHVFPAFRLVVADPAQANARAIRAFEKSGFTRTDASEDPRFVLMARARPPRWSPT